MCQAIICCFFKIFEITSLVGKYQRPAERSAGHRSYTVFLNIFLRAGILSEQQRDHHSDAKAEHGFHDPEHTDVFVQRAVHQDHHGRRSHHTEDRAVGPPLPVLEKEGDQLCDTEKADDDTDAKRQKNTHIVKHGVPGAGRTGQHFLQTAIAYTSVTLDWTNGGNEQNWVVKVFNSRIGEIIDTVSAHPATITGLTANEAYYATVQAACGSTLDGFSDWSDTISFTTSECIPVSNVACGTVNDVSVTVSWTAQGDEDAWVVEYGLPGFGQGEEIGRVVSTTNPYLLPLAGLDPNSDYEVYVYAQCTEGLNSIPAGPATFHTGSIGISGIEGNADINIYPNPTSGSTTISVSGISGKVTIDIVDMNGRTISSTTQQINDSTKVNVEGLAQGAYFVRIYGEEINSIRKLIVR